MGFDISIRLIYGFKIILSEAFDIGLLSSNILDGDDWQLISDSEYRNEMIDQHVLSNQFKSILSNGEWDLYILTSTQEEQNSDNSYLFLFNKMETLAQGTPDYKTGVVDIQHKDYSEPEKILKATYPELMDMSYQLHWVVETSW